jgi:hypothetical protein
MQPEMSSAGHEHIEVNRRKYAKESFHGGHLVGREQRNIFA